MTANIALELQKNSRIYYIFLYDFIIKSNEEANFSVAIRFFAIAVLDILTYLKNPSV